MTAWYIDRDGTRWRACKITDRLFSRVTVETWDGYILQGVARRGMYGELVTAIQN